MGVTGEIPTQSEETGTNMDRRSFLALLGFGAGGFGSGVAWRSLGTSGRSEPRTKSDAGGLEPASTGQQRIIWSVETDSPLAALTFDDGPDPRFTPRILDALSAHSLKATFFALGHNAARHPALLREVVEAGHEVGSHGWRHLNLADASPDETRLEIVKGTEMVEHHAQVPVRAFRPPYGRFNEVAIRLLATRPEDMYVWSVTRGQLSWQDPRQVARYVASEAGSGDIVDLHDGIGRGTFNPGREFTRRLVARRGVEIDALPEILERASAAGLRFTTVSNLMKRRLRSRAI